METNEDSDETNNINKCSHSDCKSNGNGNSNGIIKYVSYEAWSKTADDFAKFQIEMDKEFEISRGNFLTSRVSKLNE